MSAAWPAGVAGVVGGGVSRAGGGGVVGVSGPYQYPASVAPNLPHAHTHAHALTHTHTRARVLRCNLTTLTEVIECAGFVLRFLLQVC